MLAARSPHVAAEPGVSRRCPAKWYTRRLTDGPAGLEDRPSTLERSPSRTPAGNVADLIEEMRRATKFGAACLAAILQAEPGITVAPVPVHRILARRGISRVADLDPPSGEKLCAVLRFEHGAADSLIHVDIKKLGCIPTGGPAPLYGERQTVFKVKTSIWMQEGTVRQSTTQPGV